MDVTPPPPTGLWRLACYRCGDSGKLLALKKDENALPYAFRCSCPRGFASQICFPRWSGEAENNYEPLTGVQGRTA